MKQIATTVSPLPPLSSGANKKKDPKHHSTKHLTTQKISAHSVPIPAPKSRIPYRPLSVPSAMPANWPTLPPRNVPPALHPHHTTPYSTAPMQYRDRPVSLTYPTQSFLGARPQIFNQVCAHGSLLCEYRGVSVGSENLFTSLLVQFIKNTLAIGSAYVIFYDISS